MSELEMFQQIEQDEVDRVDEVKAFIKNQCVVTKHINKNVTSYRWKHIAEEEIGRYVSNATFIRACRELGLNDVVEDHSPLNTYFNLATRFRTKQGLWSNGYKVYRSERGMWSFKFNYQDLLWASKKGVTLDVPQMAKRYRRN